MMNLGRVSWSTMTHGFAVLCASTSAGYTIVEASTGDEALEKVRPIDVELLDFKMPSERARSDHDPCGGSHGYPRTPFCNLPLPRLTVMVTVSSCAIRLCWEHNRTRFRRAGLLTNYPS
jgi:hypothetical protein